MAKVERFLKSKYETNRFSRMSAESKVSILKMFADSVKNISPAQVTTYQCKAFYNSAKARVAPSTAESYLFTVRSFFNWCVAEKAVPEKSGDRSATRPH
jgi:site-specific recombinase XerD